MSKELCDNETGLCSVEGSNISVIQRENFYNNKEIIYAGDPMCSWCYGASNVVSDLQKYCDEHDIKFSIYVGGLRVGAAEEWNAEFKSFLKNEWQKISEKTSMPFGYSLFDKETFLYNTEPACRAVVSAKKILIDNNSKLLCEFFLSIQEHFYIDNFDPKETEFYRSICENFGLDFKEFVTVFESDEIKKATKEEFFKCGSLGVRGFPSFVYIKDKQAYLIGSGYTTLEKLTSRIEAK
ncbi:MAG: DsbA family protein [Campylobacteraceae bacterium]